MTSKTQGSYWDQNSRWGKMSIFDRSWHIADPVSYIAYMFQVSHLLPVNPYSNSSDDYVLLHPDTAHYIWFPDIYIGKRKYNYTYFILVKSISDFAKDLRIPKFMVAPASLRIYRNSTARYATQSVQRSFMSVKYFPNLISGITMMLPVQWTSENIHMTLRFVK